MHSSSWWRRRKHRSNWTHRWRQKWSRRMFRGSVSQNFSLFFRASINLSDLENIYFVYFKADSSLTFRMFEKNAPYFPFILQFSSILQQRVHDWFHFRISEPIKQCKMNLHSQGMNFSYSMKWKEHWIRWFFSSLISNNSIRKTCDDILATKCTRLDE